MSSLWSLKGDFRGPTSNPNPSESSKSKRASSDASTWIGCCILFWIRSASILEWVFLTMNLSNLSWCELLRRTGTVPDVFSTVNNLPWRAFVRKPGSFLFFPCNWAPHPGQFRFDSSSCIGVYLSFRGCCFVCKAALVEKRSLGREKRPSFISRAANESRGNFCLECPFLPNGQQKTSRYGRLMGWLWDI